MWCHCPRCNIIFRVLQIQGSKKNMLKRSRFFWFIMLTVAEMTVPAAVQDVYCSLSVQPEVPNVHGLFFFEIIIWQIGLLWLFAICVNLHRLGVCMRPWQLWNSNPWVDSHLFPYVLDHPLKLFLAQCYLHCVGQLEKNSHIHRELRGLRSFASDVFWDSACFEGKIKSSTAILLSKAVYFFTLMGFSFVLFVAI